MDEEASGGKGSEGRELGLALLKFVMESSVLGRSGGELGILPVSVPFAALIESSLFPPLRTQERERERERADFFALLPHDDDGATAQERRGEGRGRQKERHADLESKRGLTTLHCNA